MVMLTEEAIDRALLAHGDWKRRLAQAIDRDGEGLSIQVVKSDDLCEFGLWLYRDLDDSIKSLPIYERARQLHAEFHREAGRVLAMAQSKHRFEAKDAIEPDSQFARLSGALTLVLDKWRFRARKATQEFPTQPK